MLINAAIIILGFWAPWIEPWHIGRRISLLEWLALELSRTGIASFSTGTTALLILASLIAAKAVLFRVWGAAYLGPTTVNSGSMVAGEVMADGPYRYMRNPLYIGLLCMVIALAFLMPVTGAAFALILITAFSIRLTLGEEAFLTAKIGEPYAAYLHAVPRFIPRFRGAPVPAGTKPQWLRAFVAELTPIGVLVAIIVYARNYDPQLTGRIILIFFGASLVVRAFLPRVNVNPEPMK
ncbi:methyltransferase [Telmatobacter sp. DSM 110680]|uniref:Methyltransferase n=1 Tax=Telmatobacter sp. DSM 110680 TaxID=3036704 RepID=A0AAU7DM63_9BACT